VHRTNDHITAQKTEGKFEKWDILNKITIKQTASMNRNNNKAGNVRITKY
jgi:hypothetical protein